MKLSIVVPVYNSSKIIEDSYEKFKEVAEKITKDYEILFRDDFSKDNSKNILSKIVKKDKKVKIFLNDKNYGLGYTLRNLFKDASGRYVVYFDMDAPLSFDLDNFPIFLDKCDDCYSVIASRYVENPLLPFSRWFVSEFYYVINKILFNINIRDIGSGFVIFKKEALDILDLNCDGFDIHIEIFAKLQKNGFNVKEVPVAYRHWTGGSFRIFKHGPKTLFNTFKLWRKII